MRLLCMAVGLQVRYAQCWRRMTFGRDAVVPRHAASTCDGYVLELGAAVADSRSTAFHTLPEFKPCNRYLRIQAESRCICRCSKGQAARAGSGG